MGRSSVQGGDALVRGTLIRQDDRYVVTVPLEEVERLRLHEGQVVTVDIQATDEEDAGIDQASQPGGGRRAVRPPPLGDGLRSDAVAPVAPAARYIGRSHHWQIWGDLLHSVQTGENANHHVHGMSGWEYRAQHLEEGTAFDAWCAPA